MKPAECRPGFLIPLRALTVKAPQVWCSGDELQHSRDTHAAMCTRACTQAAAARNNSTQQHHLLTTLKGQQRTKWQEEHTKVPQKERRGQEPRLLTPPVGFASQGKSSFSAADRGCRRIQEKMSSYWWGPVKVPSLSSCTSLCGHSAKMRNSTCAVPGWPWGESNRTQFWPATQICHQGWAWWEAPLIFWHAQRNTFHHTNIWCVWESHSNGC